VNIVTYDGFDFMRTDFEGTTTFDPVDDAPITIFEEPHGAWSVHKMYPNSQRRSGFVYEKKNFRNLDRAFQSATTFLKSQAGKY